MNSTRSSRFYKKKLALLALGSAALPAFGQAAENLDTLVVSAPLNKSLEQTALPVNIIDGDTLKNNSANTVADIISQEVGVRSSSFGPSVGIPVIRGQGGDRVRVLQNGLGSGDVSGVSPDHASGVEGLFADRIEVLRGPATLLYGSGATGGIVNVIDPRITTKPNQGSSGEFVQFHDTAADADTTAIQLQHSAERYGLYVDGFYRDRNNVEISGESFRDGDDEESSDGFIANSDGRSKGASIGASWFSDKGFFGLSIQHLENNYGIPPGAHGEEEGEEEEEEEEIVRIDLSQTRLDLKGSIYQFDSEILDSATLEFAINDYEHDELEGAAVGTVFENDTFEGRLTLNHTLSPSVQGVWGIQFNYRNFFSDGLEAFVDPADIDDIAIFAVESWNHGDWTYEFGLRLAHQEINPINAEEVDHSPFSLSASAIWNYDANHSLFGSLSLSQRAPTLEELFSDGFHVATNSFELGDTGLDEETSLNLELGWRLNSELWQGEFSLFFNSVDDYIEAINTDLVFDEETESFVASATCPECPPVLEYQQQDAEFWGYEFTLTRQLDQVVPQLDLTVFSDWVQGEFDDGEDVPRLPPLRVGTQLNHSYQNWASELRLAYNDEQDRPGINESTSPSYTELNAQVSYEHKLPKDSSLRVYLEGKNLLDEEIRNATSFLRDLAPEPGRSFELGLRLTF